MVILSGATFHLHDNSSTNVSREYTFLYNARGITHVFVGVERIVLFQSPGLTSAVRLPIRSRRFRFWRRPQCPDMCKVDMDLPGPSKVP